jgi:hypothetical protein
MNNKHAKKVISGMMLLGALVLLGGCVNTASDPTLIVVSRPPTPPTTLPCDAQPADQVIAVRFSEDGCPKEAYPNNFLIEGEDKFLCWVSADSAGNRKHYAFKLWFDPLVGPNPSSGPNGLFRRQIKNNAPLTAQGVEYKYTVEGENCGSANPDDKYLDPRFWGRK